jgi:hypothetical protein
MTDGENQAEKYEMVVAGLNQRPPKKALLLDYKKRTYLMIVPNHNQNTNKYRKEYITVFSSIPCATK